MASSPPLGVEEFLYFLLQNRTALFKTEHRSACLSCTQEVRLVHQSPAHYKADQLLSALATEYQL